jgi:hypothetical protein
VGVDVGAHLDFLDLDGLLLLARLGGLLLVLVFQFPEIEDLADGRVRIRSDLDEIESGLLGERKRLIRRDDTAIIAFGIDELDAGNPDLVVRAGSFLGGWWRSERSANGRILLICFWITSEKNSLFGTSGGNVVIAVAKSIARPPEKITTGASGSESRL